MSIDLNTLSAALHSIKISNGTYDLSIGSSGELLAAQSGTWNIGTVASITADVNVADGGNSLTVDGTVAATQSGTWDIGTLGTITNVVHIDDNASTISIDDAGGAITVDGTVAATQSGTWDIGTVGTITNVVHIDDNASTISIDDGGSSITVDGTVSTTPAAYSSWQVEAVTVTNTATAIVATSPLANRLSAIIQNVGNADMFVGPTNAVTVASGLLISKGFSQEVALDDDATIYGISAGTTNVRFAEFAD